MVLMTGEMFLAPRGITMVLMTGAMFLALFNENVQLNRRFIELAIRAVLLLGKQELFISWSSQKSVSSSNCGNFKELLKSYFLEPCGKIL